MFENCFKVVAEPCKIAVSKIPENFTKIMKNEKPSRRDFLTASAAGVAALSVIKNASARNFAADTNEELIETTVQELQAKMQSGEI